MPRSEAVRHRTLWAELVAQVVLNDQLDLQPVATDYTSSGHGQADSNPVGEVGFEFDEAGHGRLTVRPQRVTVHGDVNISGDAPLWLVEGYRVGFFDGGAAAEGNGNGREARLALDSARDVAGTLLETVTYRLEH